MQLFFFSVQSGNSEVKFILSQAKTHFQCFKLSYRFNFCSFIFCFLGLNVTYKTNTPLFPSSPPPLPLNILLGPGLRKRIKPHLPRSLASSNRLIHVSIDLIIPGGSSSRKLAINTSQYNLICFDSDYMTADSFLPVKSEVIMSIICFIWWNLCADVLVSP